jgi:fumarylacetoacetase
LRFPADTGHQEGHDEAVAHEQQTWVSLPEGTDFPLENLPFGVFTHGGGAARVGVAIGADVLDLSQVDIACRDDFAQPVLNRFLSRGRAAWSAVRARLVQLLTDPGHRPAVQPHLVPLSEVELRLPVEVADYVDFYSSEHHAANVGRMFRPNAEPLSPNWRHLPIAYHGRAGTVVVSGTPIVRPHGQQRPDRDGAPVYGPSRRLDVEAEVGFVVGVPTGLGQRVAVADFADHVFGVVLLNDWSARDIQSFENVPLGPFLSKSFATSISPWVVPLSALDSARIPSPVQDPAPLPYLRSEEPWGLDLTLEIECNGTVVSRPPYAQMYWSAAQQLAHLTVNGASLRTGDLYASGTVSGPTWGERGSFLELSWNGTEPVELADGTTRTFLEDGDTVTIRGHARGPGGSRIGFGAVTGTLLAAR